MFQVDATAPFQARLGVIGHVPHETRADGETWAYEPYVREMRIWAGLFREVEVCSPMLDEKATHAVAAYQCPNLRWTPVSYTLKSGRRATITRLAQTAGLIRAAWRTVQRSDVVHLRSPGHFGLIGAVLARLARRFSITKWAGENAAYEGERFPSVVDRWFQGIQDPRHPVLVYGRPKRSHQISFIPALMSDEELESSRRMSGERRWQPPWKICSVGRLEGVKGFDLALRGLGEARARQPGLNWHYTLVGDGTQRPALEALAREMKIDDRVSFAGTLPFDQAQAVYARSHMVIMPGTKEGWPKVIAEAWAHGAIPLAARGGIVPEIIEEGGQVGVVFEPQATACAGAFVELLRRGTELSELSRRAYQAAASLSLEQFRCRLQGVIAQRFGDQLVGRHPR